MTLAMLLLMTLTADEAGLRCSPATELRAAWNDLRESVAASHYADTRYLTLYSLPPGQRADAAAVVSFVLNSVSRAAVIIRPELVPGTQGRLLRFALSSYGIPPDVWEALAAEDPYFHLR